MNKEDVETQIKDLSLKNKDFLFRIYKQLGYLFACRRDIPRQEECFDIADAILVNIFGVECSV